MQELLGQIGATIVAGVLILSLAVIAWRGQHHAMSAAQYTAAKEGLLDFARVMEEDLSNLGTGLTLATLESGYGAFPGSNSYDEYNYLEFYTWADREREDLRDRDDSDRVRYTWTPTGTTPIFDPATNTFSDSTTYRITRTIRYWTGPSTWGPPVAAGSSLDTVTESTIEFFRGNGTTTTAGGDVVAVQVTLAAVSPLGGRTGYQDVADQRRQIAETRWSRTFIPFSLRRTLF